MKASLFLGEIVGLITHTVWVIFACMFFFCCLFFYVNGCLLKDPKQDEMLCCRATQT